MKKALLGGGHSSRFNGRTFRAANKYRLSTRRALSAGRTRTAISSMRRDRKSRIAILHHLVMFVQTCMVVILGFENADLTAIYSWHSLSMVNVLLTRQPANLACVITSSPTNSTTNPPTSSVGSRVPSTPKPNAGNAPYVLSFPTCTRSRTRNTASSKTPAPPAARSSISNSKNSANSLNNVYLCLSLFVFLFTSLTP